MDNHSKWLVILQSSIWYLIILPLRNVGHTESTLLYMWLCSVCTSDHWCPAQLDAHNFLAIEKANIFCKHYHIWQKYNSLMKTVSLLVDLVFTRMMKYYVACGWGILCPTQVLLEMQQVDVLLLL